MIDESQHISQSTQIVRQILKDANLKSHAFTEQTKIVCKSGCGACCKKPNQVWATVGEMLPMAMDFFNAGCAEDMIMTIENIPDNNMCVVFQPDAKINGNGRCGNYENRPLTCILFGASAVHNQSNEFRFLGCHWLKDHYQKYLELEGSDYFKKGQDASVLPMKLKSALIDDRLKEEHPINNALKLALEFILWTNYLTQLHDPISFGPIDSSAP